MALPERTHPARRVASAAGIKPETLRAWRRADRAVIDAPKAKKGTRPRTHYTETEALRICVIAALTRAGLSLERATDLLEENEIFSARDTRLYDGRPVYMVARYGEQPDLSEGGWVVSYGSRELEPLTSSDPYEKIVFVLDVAKLFRSALDRLRKESIDG